MASPVKPKELPIPAMYNQSPKPLNIDTRISTTQEVSNLVEPQAQPKDIPSSPLLEDKASSDVKFPALQVSHPDPNAQAQQAQLMQQQMQYVMMQRQMLFNPMYRQMMYNQMLQRNMAQMGMMGRMGVPSMPPTTLGARPAPVPPANPAPAPPANPTTLGTSGNFLS